MKNISLLIFCTISLQVFCQNKPSKDTLDFGSDSLGITQDYSARDGSIMERNSGLKFFAFIHAQKLKGFMRCGQCFFLRDEETKTNYFISESESCRTHKNKPVSITKNGQEIGFPGLREVAELIMKNRDSLRETVSKKPLEKGEVGYVIPYKKYLVKK